MMKAAIDLHIHTALSPCASDDMTPNNIINMAHLKGLDIIAITDHNSAANCEAVIKCVGGTGILVIPGIELETVEEVHLLCFFRMLTDALSFEKIIQQRMPEISNREDIFGRQLLMDEYDNITGYKNQLLLTASGITAEEAFSMVKEAGGMVIPAHIDRDTYSLLSNFGCIPDYSDLSCLEISKKCNSELFLQRFPGISRYGFITSSDAHHLGDILERKMLLDLVKPDIDQLFIALGQKLCVKSVFK